MIWNLVRRSNLTCLHCYSISADIEATPYAWVDSMMSPAARDTLQVIDKQTLFDARTLAEVKRSMMKKPIGKYNVHNKVTRSEGTSP